MSPTSQSAIVAARRFPWGIVVVMSIVLFGSLAVRAEASCGDYLHRENVFGDGNEATVEIGNDRQHHAQEPSQPCSGPTCRRAPETPARSAPAEDRASNIERPALLSSGAVTNSPASGWLRPGNPPIELEDHRRDLDRPPRSC